MGQSKVTIKGTGQLNGNVVINKTVEMDSAMANKFMGSNRYEVIEAFLNTNYPGVKVNPKNFGVNVVPIKSSSEKSSLSKPSSTSKSSSGSRKSILSKTGSAVVGTASVIGAIGGFLLNSDDDDDEIEEKKMEAKNYITEKEKIDLEFYKKEKELEYEKQKRILQKEKTDNYKKQINTAGSFLSKSWNNNKKAWKIGIFIVVIFYLIMGILFFIYISKNK